MKRLKRIAGAGLALALIWWVSQRVFVTEEKRVRRALASLESAVETGNIFKLDAGIAQDYTDTFGFDKPTAINAVRVFRAQHDSIFIHISDLTVTVEPDGQRAQAAFIAKILAKPKGALTESELRTDRFRVTFRKTGQGWQLTGTESPELKFD